MEAEASGDTSGSDGGGPTARDSGVQSVSGVTEAGSSGNEKARRQGGGGVDDDHDDRGGHGRLAVVERPDGGEGREAGGAEGAPSFPVRLAAASIGWLLLGFLAGAAVAAAVLFVMREDVPATCTVPT